jgi:hypothetical protein
MAEAIPKEVQPIMSKISRALQNAVGCVLYLALISLPAPALAQSGYFHVEQRNGVWWIIDPEGNPTLSAGVDHISYAPDRVRGTNACPYCEAVEKIYPDRTAWDLMALARIRLWGFNTVGAWSDRGLWEFHTPYTVILDIASHSGADWQHGKPADFFDPRFERTAGEIAESECAPRKADPMLLGYFSDNELRWGPDWRGKETMLEMYLGLPEGAGGKQKALEFLRGRYANDIAGLNRAWGVDAKSFDSIPSPARTDAFKKDADDFLGIVADRYFDVCLRAVRAADPNHLFLGARFAGKPPDSVFRASKVSDIVSVNIYSMDPRPLVKHVYELTGRPIMITEFAFRATDSGLPNTRGAGPKVPNQRERAKAFSDYVTWLESLPEAVGYHWFQWADEPKEGRFDGENSNYGLVDINDNPYEEFVEAVKAANLAARGTHEQSGK